jgi:hypothetical protein
MIQDFYYQPLRLRRRRLSQSLAQRRPQLLALAADVADFCLTEKTKSNFPLFPQLSKGKTHFLTNASFLSSIFLHFSSFFFICLNIVAELNPPKYPAEMFVLPILRCSFCLHRPLINPNPLSEVARTTTALLLCPTTAHTANLSLMSACSSLKFNLL